MMTRFENMHLLFEIFCLISSHVYFFNGKSELSGTVNRFVNNTVGTTPQFSDHIERLCRIFKFPFQFLIDVQLLTKVDRTTDLEHRSGAMFGANLYLATNRAELIWLFFHTFTSHTIDTLVLLGECEEVLLALEPNTFQIAGEAKGGRRGWRYANSVFVLAQPATHCAGHLAFYFDASLWIREVVRGEAGTFFPTVCDHIQTGAAEAFGERTGRTRLSGLIVGGQSTVAQNGYFARQHRQVDALVLVLVLVCDDILKRDIVGGL
mmetsp:Transcript_12715/g.32407  ORF Transcript_12715/g.32407 Transcript_12715/m.32407 type:complete len:264 (+) Transcript_12715:2223-3014(+)